MKKFLKYIKSSEFFNFMFYMCVIFMVIDVMTAGIMFILGAWTAGFVNLFWAVFMALCAWLNSKTAKMIEKEEKEKK